MAKDDLPRRTDKAARREAQEEAAERERRTGSFSVPDRFADRRTDGKGSYTHERD